ncbi:MAG TPA: hypothetical protein PLK99_03215 [Burkholderiales bacterium]|nr:hypothetical protein [Burkholderiales bacterium]
MIGALAVAIIAVIVFLIRASTRNLYFGDWWARSFKMRSWKKKTAGIENRSTWEESGMPAPEKELCDYYLKYASATDRRTFNNAVEWLKLTGQGGVKPTSLWVWGVLFLLTIGEAAGTGMLLAGSISNKITGNEIAPFGFILATILAFGLLWLTHTAGREAAFSSAIQQHLGTSVASETFGARKISPADDFRIDEGVDDNRRFANRALSGDHHRANRWARVTSALILALLVAAIFAIRYYNNQQEYDNRVRELPSNSGCGAPAGSSDPFASMQAGPSIPGFAPGTVSPPSVKCDATTVNNNGAKDSIRSTEISSDFSAAVLALLYVIVQFIGFVTAWKHSFFGEGEKAFEITRGYPNYDELSRDRLEPVYKLGNVALQSLRNHLTQRINSYRDNPSHMDIQQYAMRKKYNVDATVSAEELDNRIGMDAYRASQDYRENLSRSGVTVKPAASLAKYREMIEIEEHARQVDLEIKRLQGESRLQRAREEATRAAPPAPISAPQPHLEPELLQQKHFSRHPVLSPEPPPAADQREAVPARPDLSLYGIMDIEAAEELLKAGGVLERRQLLQALSEGDEAKKALLLEIYAKLKGA